MVERRIVAVWLLVVVCGALSTSCLQPPRCNNDVNCPAGTFCGLGGRCGPAPAPDAGPPADDAGLPADDAGLPADDAGLLVDDAGQPDPDAGAPQLDAGLPDPDAGAPPVDAGPLDAGAPLVDAGPPDAGQPDPDAGPGFVPIDGYYQGEYSWDCGGFNTGQVPMVVELDFVGGVLGGELQYLGDRAALANGTSFNILNNVARLVHTASPNAAFNEFTGTYDGTVGITGTTLNGDSNGGCSAAVGPSGSFLLRRENLEGIWSGTYDWDCDNGQTGTSTMIVTFGPLPDQDVANFGTASVDYLGEQGPSAAGSRFERFDRRVVLVTPSQANRVNNEFTGTLVRDTISGTTLNGDSNGGCSAPTGPSGTFSLTR